MKSVETIAKCTFFGAVGMPNCRLASLYLEGDPRANLDPNTILIYAILGAKVGFAFGLISAIVEKFTGTDLAKIALNI